MAAEQRHVVTDAAPMLHATTVAVEGKGIVIVGASGSGKSALALALIAFGAKLVADDRTVLTRQGTQVLADVPGTIAGMIEAREVGLIAVPHAAPVEVCLVIDMDQIEGSRLPVEHTYELLGTVFPCLHKSEKPHFPAAVLLYIKDNQRFSDAP